MRLALLLLAFLASPLAAAAPIVSAGPDSVAVTIYRAPDRSPGQAIDPKEERLGGYALITETRTVDLPRGPVTIRFEGVASGVQPETAILVGADTREKNQDRLLLSQRALLDAFTGQQVILRRTDPATGKVTEIPARVRSGANGIVVETAAGFEALHCTGLNETLLYPNLPAGVSAKPVLSVATGDQPGGRQTLTLSYLTGNFDWQANYVGDLSTDGTRLDLFAWVTLASRDDTSFVAARTNAIAGRVARAENWDSERSDDMDQRVVARCWPGMTTSTPEPPPPPPPPPPAPMVMMMASREMAGQDIVVTGTKVRQEQIGDLKLYRILRPVTVAARSQKQVLFLSKRSVKGELLYRSELGNHSGGDGPQMLFRMQNRKDQGLGEPLPAGQVTLFQNASGRRLLIGESDIADKAVGEEVELIFGEATNVEVDSEDLGEGDKWREHRLAVANANPFPILYEARFHDGETRFERFSRPVVRRNGRSIWRVVVPANGKATLSYRETDIED
ncbi:MAG: hypothetical protein JWO25_2028 [Alphaproteobacteria bacterium]|nr:hypothetical protein [Alphaproteobacteria bacterium]